jgi:hypothetical protein
MESVDDANVSLYARDYTRKSLQRGFEASMLAWYVILKHYVSM